MNSLDLFYRVTIAISRGLFVGSENDHGILESAGHIVSVDENVWDDDGWPDIRGCQLLEFGGGGELESVIIWLYDGVKKIFAGKMVSEIDGVRASGPKENVFQWALDGDILSLHFWVYQRIQAPNYSIKHVLCPQWQHDLSMDFTISMINEFKLSVIWLFFYMVHMIQIN